MQAGRVDEGDEEEENVCVRLRKFVRVADRHHCVAPSVQSSLCFLTRFPRHFKSAALTSASLCPFPLRPSFVSKPPLWSRLQCFSPRFVFVCFVLFFSRFFSVDSMFVDLWKQASSSQGHFFLHYPTDTSAARNGRVRFKCLF